MRLRRTSTVPEVFSKLGFAALFTARICSASPAGSGLSHEMLTEPVFVSQSTSPKTAGRGVGNDVWNVTETMLDARPLESHTCRRRTYVRLFCRMVDSALDVAAEAVSIVSIVFPLSSTRIRRYRDCGSDSASEYDHCAVTVADATMPPFVGDTHAAVGAVVAKNVESTYQSLKFGCWPLVRTFHRYRRFGVNDPAVKRRN